ncbi:RsmB/NOP family class I SAM-dependent RNA methyltransferase [Paremcibacter congregatus]|uniref:RsmB/NOP family class I SAM-dependent RNA methyltransferase n=1 Tax=Paremcibacter congregatus TaxID=2043170 RepID=UPI0030EDDB36|tara:strand:+ start:27463 stop:28785 length:1323 start_codon:yes stop_codon:yes gene_type:complete
MANDLIGRWAALAFLERILDEHLPLDQAFEQTCRFYGDKLTVQDRAFVRHLGTSCLRHLGQLDAMINHCTTTKLTSKKKTVRNILRLAITQLLYMQVPAHAAVNSAVKMTDKQKNSSDRHAKGMVNAILRRIDREQEKFSTKFSPGLNIPKWLKASWVARYGSGQVDDMAVALLAEPPLDFSLKDQTAAKQWAEKLGGIELPNGSVRVEKAGPVAQLDGYEEGQWWVQDTAASLPATLLGAKSGDRVLDLCAAPGGKTAQSLAKGCQVTAVDQSARRLRRFEENMSRLGFSCETVVTDAATYSPDEPFAFILLDAPCSSTGTMRRHPEVSRMRGPLDIMALAEIQKNLLDAAMSILPVGGRLIYCVCSLQTEEGPDQIAALLSRNEKIQRVPITADELTGFGQAIMDNGDVQTLPHHNPAANIPGGMDGFFISRLTKTSD